MGSRWVSNKLHHVRQLKSCWTYKWPPLYCHHRAVKKPDRVSMIEIEFYTDKATHLALIFQSKKTQRKISPWIKAASMLARNLKRYVQMQTNLHCQKTWPSPNDPVSSSTMEADPSDKSSPQWLGTHPVVPYTPDAVFCAPWSLELSYYRTPRPSGTSISPLDNRVSVKSVPQTSRPSGGPQCRRESRNDERCVSMLVHLGKGDMWKYVDGVLWGGPSDWEKG